MSECAFAGAAVFVLRRSMKQRLSRLVFQVPFWCESLRGVGFSALPRVKRLCAEAFYGTKIPDGVVALGASALLLRTDGWRVSGLAQAGP